MANIMRAIQATSAAHKITDKSGIENSVFAARRHLGLDSAKPSAPKLAQ